MGSMECERCENESVIRQAYAGIHLCEDHFRESVERRVRRRIRQDGLLGDGASPEDPVTWIVGLSGGKDSAVLLTVLAETFDRDPRVEFIALTVHEGIAGYRDESLQATEKLVDRLDVRHDVITYEEEFNVRMDEVAEADPLGMAPCAYCGVFRRDLLSSHAKQFGADLLLTGHNLDDEAETALMNLLEGDVHQIAEHFDASLGPMGDRNESTAFVPRAKPLRDIPEREVALYAHLRDLPAHFAECPHADRSFRGTVRDLLLELEEDHPGTRHSIMAGYEELAKLAATRHRSDDGQEFGSCNQCGNPTAASVCRRCQLLEAVSGEA